MPIAPYLEGLVNEKTNDDTTRADLVGRIASASNISESTVNQILNGSTRPTFA